VKTTAPHPHKAAPPPRSPNAPWKSLRRNLESRRSYDSRSRSRSSSRSKSRGRNRNIIDFSAHVDAGQVETQPKATPSEFSKAPPLSKASTPQRRSLSPSAQVRKIPERFRQSTVSNNNRRYDSRSPSPIRNIPPPRRSISRGRDIRDRSADQYRAYSPPANASPQSSQRRSTPSPVMPLDTSFVLKLNALDMKVEISMDNPDRMEGVLNIPQEYLNHNRSSNILMGKPHGQRQCKIINDLTKDSLFLEFDRSEHHEIAGGFYFHFKQHMGKNAFQQEFTKNPNFMYFWDKSDGDFFSGWWLSDEIGAEEFLMFNTDPAENPRYCQGVWQGDYKTKRIEYAEGEENVMIEYANGQLRIEADDEWTVRRGMAMMIEAFQNVEKMAPVERKQIFEHRILASEVSNQLYQNAVNQGCQIIILNFPEKPKENIQDRFNNLCIENHTALPEFMETFPGTGDQPWAGSAILKFAKEKDAITCLLALHDIEFEGRNLCVEYVEGNPIKTPEEVHWAYGQKGRYRTKMCAFLEKNMVCPRDDKCVYAHNDRLRNKVYFEPFVKLKMEHTFRMTQLPIDAVESHEDLVCFLRSVVLDIGLKEAQILTTTPPTASVKYDTLENAVKALKGLVQISIHQSIPLQMIWMDPEDFDYRYDGPPQEIVEYYSTKKELKIPCWNYQYKRCLNENCPFVHRAKTNFSRPQINLNEPRSKAGPPKKPSFFTKYNDVSNWFGESTIGQYHVIISNLPSSAAVSTQYIRNLLAPFCSATNVDIYLVRNFMGTFSNEVYVSFPTIERCLRVLKLLNGFEIEGRKLNVNWRHLNHRLYLGPPQQVFDIYDTDPRRKTVECWHVANKKLCPCIKRNIICPFYHVEVERRKNVVEDYEIVVRRLPTTMTKAAVEKELNEIAGVEVFHWHNDGNSNTDFHLSTGSGVAKFKCIGKALDSLDILAGMPIGDENNYITVFYTEDRIPPKIVVEFYKRDRFENSRLCGYEKCPLMDNECPFAHSASQIFPNYERPLQYTPWRDSVRDAFTEVEWDNLGIEPKRVVLSPERINVAPGIQLDPMSSPKNKNGMVNPLIAAISKNAPPQKPASLLSGSPAPNRSPSPTQEHEPVIDDMLIDYSFCRHQVSKADLEEIPKEWNLTPEEFKKEEKKKAKAQLSSQQILVFGFPVDMDFSEIKGIINKVGDDVLDLSMVEPGLVEFKLGSDSIFSWYERIAQVQVQGKLLQVLNPVQRPIKKDRKDRKDRKRHRDPRVSTSTDLASVDNQPRHRSEKHPSNTSKKGRSSTLALEDAPPGDNKKNMDIKGKSTTLALEDGTVRTEKRQTSRSIRRAQRAQNLEKEQEWKRQREKLREVDLEREKQEEEETKKRDASEKKRRDESEERKIEEEKRKIEEEKKKKKRKRSRSTSKTTKK